jgi:SAM-dependent methyltransferase
MTLIERVHGNFVYNRRVERLCTHLSAVMPHGRARVLDIGCGDGLLSSMIMEARSDLEIVGIDVLIRPRTHIPVTEFDGRRIPFANDSVDGAMFVDVLHHTPDPMVLLREAARVARSAIVIKDHTANGFLAARTLRFMDEVGNARHGVALPFNYWTRERWMEAFETLGQRVAAWNDRLGLYPRPASWVFDRSLHFVARLEKGRD